ncbi:BLUF domain-containing protein [Microvirga sp. STS02]|nr:BLUF domain-containing protein [Microvirga sp. STS02]MBR7208037.1 BLUF domain-containing protein [Microvirga sp. STS02]
MGLYHLLYQSQALANFSLPELLELLQKSRAYNAARGITGILLHAPNGQFLQLLEGEKGTVQHLYYDRIAADPRHEHLVVLSEGPGTAQLFPDWSMSFRSGTGLPAPPGYLAPSAAYFRVSNLVQAPPELKHLLLDFTAGYDDSPLAESMIGSRR